MNLLGSYGLATITNMMPYNIPHMLYDFNTSKFTMGYSSMPDLGQGFNFDGMKTKGFLGIGP